MVEVCDSGKHAGRVTEIAMLPCFTCKTLKCYIYYSINPNDITNDGRCGRNHGWMGESPFHFIALQDK